MGSSRPGSAPPGAPLTIDCGVAIPVDEQPDRDLRVDPSLLRKANLAQFVLVLGLGLQRGDVKQAQGHIPTGSPQPDDQQERQRFLTDCGHDLVLAAVICGDIEQVGEIKIVLGAHF